MIERIVTSIIVILLAGYCCHEAAGQGPIRKRLMPQAGPPTSARSAGGITKLPARMAEGTKNAFSGARERLKFWDRTEKRQSSEFVEGTGRFFRPDLPRKENERKPFSFVRAASWFEAETDEPGPTSVHDWIGQPRPGFD